MDEKRSDLESFEELLKEALTNNQSKNQMNLVTTFSTVLDKTVTYLNEEKKERFENKLQSFITSRISDINNDETPIKLESATKVILHLIPLNIFNQKEQLINIKALNQRFSYLTPLASSSYDRRYNYGGYLTYNKNGYTQVFRNGCIEAVSNRFYNETNKKFYASEFESSVIENTPQYIKVLNQLDIKGPIYIYITLMGVKGYTLAAPYGYFFDDYKIDKKDISLPRVLIKDPENIAVPLKIAFDVLWNSGGVPESINYQNGEWKPR